MALWQCSFFRGDVTCVDSLYVPTLGFAGMTVLYLFNHSVDHNININVGIFHSSGWKHPA